MHSYRAMLARHEVPTGIDEPAPVRHIKGTLAVVRNTDSLRGRWFRSSSLINIASAILAADATLPTYTVGG